MLWLLRRLFWFGTGAGVGFGGAMWIRNRVRRAVARYVPERVTAEVTGGVRRAGQGARRLGGDVREAVAEGRSAMRSREEQLHTSFSPPKVPSQRDLRGRERASGGGG